LRFGIHTRGEIIAPAMIPALRVLRLS
jgi:hypothetical protein